PGLVAADRNVWTRSPRAVQVIYTTATGAVPNDVQEAYAQLIGHWYRHVKTQVGTNYQNLDSQKYGDVGLNYWPQQVAKAPVPPEVSRRPSPYGAQSVGGDLIVLSASPPQHDLQYLSSLRRGLANISHHGRPVGRGHRGWPGTRHRQSGCLVALH